MRLHVDRHSDALYLRLDDSQIVESEEVAPGLVPDYNASSEVVGVEILGLSRRSSSFDPSKLIVETTAVSLSEQPAP